jgi:hypothetical protein
MCDNEYLAHALISDRLREAEAQGALRAMIQQALEAGAARREARPTRLEAWWQASAAWVAQLTLPKMWNRL